MSWLALVVAPRAQAITTPWELHEAFLPHSSATASGAYVTADSAMRLTAVYAAVRVLSEGVAQLPLLVYRRTDAGKERATDHWLYRLLHDEPNPWQTSFEFREMLQAQLALAGNAYAIKTVVREEVRELLPVPANLVTVIQEPNLRVHYEVRLLDGKVLPVPADRMFHVPGLSFNGVVGLSPVQYNKESIGLGLQLVQHGAKLFTNGAQIAGVLKHPATLSDKAYQRLRDSFDETFAGVDNAHKTAILEEGTEWTKSGMTAEAAQFLDSRKYSRNEIATVFRVPPHMIGDLERATFTNIEHQGQEFVVYTLGPWLVRWEQRIWKSLIPRAERDTLFAQFLVEGFLRGDFKSRVDGYGKAIQDGWMSRNEVRELENMNQADGLDEFLEPLNMQRATDARPPADQLPT